MLRQAFKYFNIIRSLTNWFNLLGWPEIIHTDGGPQFRSEFEEFCKFFIHHKLLSPCHPESNGLVVAAVKNADFTQKVLKFSSASLCFETCHVQTDHHRSAFCSPCLKKQIFFSLLGLSPPLINKLRFLHGQHASCARQLILTKLLSLTAIFHPAVKSMFEMLSQNNGIRKLSSRPAETMVNHTSYN